MIINKLETKSDLEAIFREFNVQLFRYVLTRCQQKELAEEITQDVFIKAWEKRASFDARKSSLKNWLYVIARNKVIDHFRTWKPVSSLEEIEETTGPNDQKEVEAGLLMEHILEKLKILPQDDQDVLTLRYINELELSEIAKIINKNEVATRVMLHRALNKLKKIVSNDHEQNQY